MDCYLTETQLNTLLTHAGTYMTRGGNSVGCGWWTLLRTTHRPTAEIPTYFLSPVDYCSLRDARRYSEQATSWNWTYSKKCDRGHKHAKAVTDTLGEYLILNMASGRGTIVLFKSSRLTSYSFSAVYDCANWLSKSSENLCRRPPQSAPQVLR